MAAEREQRRLAWAITGSGHYVRECLQLLDALPETDVFLSRAGAEVLHMYGYRLEDLKAKHRVFRDNTASGAPVGLFYTHHYHTLVIAPATSNTVAKCVWGISDTLVTNIYAQAGKCRIPSIVFACDTAPELDSEAPRRMVKVYPRRIDLQNAARLGEIEDTRVVLDMEELRRAIEERLACLNASCS